MKTMRFKLENSNKAETRMKWVQVSTTGQNKGEVFLKSYRQKHDCSGIQDVKVGDKFIITLED